MQSIITWVTANWQPVITALLGIDALLIPIFPHATILEKIQNALKGL